MSAQLVALTTALMLGATAAGAIDFEAADSAQDAEAVSDPIEQAQDAVVQSQNDLVVARQNLEKARAHYQHMRHRRRARGEKKQLVTDTLRNAEVELNVARQSLDATTVAARRAGVSPGWLRAHHTAPPAALVED